MKASHSKMDNVFYTKLQMQGYLKAKDITPEDAKMVFSYRTRMADYTENFRGPAGP